jgi:small ligand-binding sensory domain FIST
LAADIARRTRARTLIGCTGESIVGGAREIEDGPALSLWLARLPGVTIQPMRLRFERTPEGGTIVGWPDNLPERWPDGSALMMLAEPFSFPADLLLERLNEDQPGVPVLGGMASGAHAPGENRLILSGGVRERDGGSDADCEFDSGAVAVLIHGPLRMRAVVSQGCRPIGRHFVVTRADKNVILELSGKPAMQQLQEVFDGLSDRDRQLVQRGLHVGLVTNEYQDTFRRGDFLVRNCVGADPQAGAIAIGDFVRPGQTVQFHVRDEETADEDLRELLTAAGGDANMASSASSGALLFTCNGRGTRLFSEPDHDAAAVCAALGNLPLAGFFAQGELGPIGGKNYLHGFTASVAVFG